MSLESRPQFHSIAQASWRNFAIVHRRLQVAMACSDRNKLIFQQASFLLSNQLDRWLDFLDPKRNLMHLSR